MDDFESRLGSAIRLAGELVVVSESLPARVRDTSSRPSRGHGLRTAAVLSLVLAATLSTVGLVVASHGQVTSPTTVPIGSYTDDPSMGGILQAISCASPAHCVAGGMTPGAKSLAAVQVGSAWLPQRTPNPKGARYVLINSVSCAGDACMAVGISTTVGTGSSLKPSARIVTRPLAEWWNGKHWTLTEVPLPNSGRTWLNAVACPAINRCVAVGSGSLIESWNGVGWTAEPLPSKQASSVSLYGVSCPTTTACTAVGFEQQASGGLRGVTEELAGASWRTTTIPGAALNSVSCASSEHCVAVGYLELHSSGGRASGGEATGVKIATVEPLIENWDGRHWSRSILPGKLASPAILNGTLVLGGVAAYTNGLQQVSCHSSTCVAVGFDGQAPLALARTAGAWRATPAPRAGAGEPTYLLSVSCRATTSCTATGFSERAAGEDNDVEPVVEHWNGQRWTLTFTAGDSAR